MISARRSSIPGSGAAVLVRALSVALGAARVEVASTGGTPADRLMATWGRTTGGPPFEIPVP